MTTPHATLPIADAAPIPKPAQALPDRIAAVIAGLPVWTWALAAFALIAIGSLTGRLGGLGDSLGDTDDATRLVQIRELLAGAPWYTPTLSRSAGGEAILSHWSRLVDLPIAALISLFGLAMPMSAAETAARAIWPLLVLLPLVLLFATTLDRQAGRAATAVGLLLVLLCPVALVQFQVGRIDHHNMQLLGSVGAALLLWSGLSGFGDGGGAARHESRRAMIAAGMLAGLALGVGYEALPLVAMTAVAATAWGLRDERLIGSVATFASALFATLLVAFPATVPPGRWLQVNCDTLSANLVVLSGVGAGALLILAQWGRGRSLGPRLGILAAGGCLGALLFAALEPACLAGPFGQVPAALRPIWMDHVQETFSLWTIGRQRPAEALAGTTFLLVACLVQAMAWHRTRVAGDLFLAALLVALALLACVQVKFLTYASWLAIAALAPAIARLPATRNFSAPAARLAVALTASHLGMFTLAASISDTVSILVPAKAGASQAIAGAAEACFATAATAALASLPRGLIAADVDVGPFIVAATGHTVLAAPYHRISSGITTMHRILSGPADEAEAVLRGTGADYLVVCPALHNGRADRNPSASHLAARLVRGDGPAYLERVPLEQRPMRDNPLAVYKVRPKARP